MKDKAVEFVFRDAIVILHFFFDNIFRAFFLITYFDRTVNVSLIENVEENPVVTPK